MREALIFGVYCVCVIQKNVVHSAETQEEVKLPSQKQAPNLLMRRPDKSKNSENIRTLGKMYRLQ